MKPLREHKVSHGKVAGRVRLTLVSANGNYRIWLSPKQAERLAADILSIRFDTPTLEVIAPPKINAKSKRTKERQASGTRQAGTWPVTTGEGRAEEATSPRQADIREVNEEALDGQAQTHCFWHFPFLREGTLGSRLARHHL
jgi:hypothetical protein